MKSRSTRRRGSWVVLLAGAASLIAAQPAAAEDPDPLAGEATTLIVDSAVAAALDDAGVSVAPTGDTEARGGGFSFPVSGGKLDPATPQGKVRHDGSGLRFDKGKRKVPLKDFVVEISDRPALFASPGGLKVFKLDLSGASVTRDGFATEVADVVPVLTGKAARALNDALKTDVFARGLEVGTVVARYEAQSVALLPEGDTTLALDDGAADALESLGITAAPVPPATAGMDGLAFPITGGRVDTETLAGVISHSGGISLTRDDTVVELKRFDINIDDKPDLTAKIGRDRVSILRLDLSGAAIHVADRSVTVSGVEASLTKRAADALNAAFETDAFAPGLLIGTATVSAEAR
jgi:hypothetical protein